MVKKNSLVTVSAKSGSAGGRNSSVVPRCNSAVLLFDNIILLIVCYRNINYVTEDDRLSDI